MTTIRLGTCSPPAPESSQAALALLDKLAHQAAAQGVDLLVLPEAFLGSGSPRGVSFGSTLGSGNAAGRDAFLDYFKRAVDFGDVVGDAGAGGGDAWIKEPKKEKKDDKDKDEDKKEGENRPGDGTRERIEQIAHEAGVFLVVGAVEKAGGSLYSAVVYVCPRQGTLGKRRKIQPTGIERLIWAPAGPATLRAVSTEIKGARINLAAAICWENYMPLVRQTLYAQNVNLYLAPTADGGDAWLALMRTVGIEGRCFVVTSNMCTATKPRPAQPSAASIPTEAKPVAQVRLPPQPMQRAVHPASAPAAVASGVVTTKVTEIVGPDGKSRWRKKSFVMDEDGNEIVLSCKTFEDDGSEAPAGTISRTNSICVSAAASDGPGQPPLPPFPCLPVDEAWELRKRNRRRSSIFDEDDNEIVLIKPSRASASTSSAVPEVEEAAAPANSFGPRHAPQMPDRSTAPSTRAAQPHSASDTHGGSAIVTPFGVVAAGPQWDDADRIITADVDFEDCIRGRLNLDVAGHYSRNDSFRLSVTGLDLSPQSY